MSRGILAWLVALLAGAGSLLGGATRTALPPTAPLRSLGVQPSANDQLAATTRAYLDRYCVTCHNARLRTAGLTLDAMDPARVEHGSDAWEKVVLKLQSGAMPPPGLPRGDRAATGSVIAWLESSLDRLAADHPKPGRPPFLHRLNRTEYTNAIRDLLALDVDARAFLPADDSNHGFDNMAAVLTVSPVLLERYLFAARTISRLAIGDPTITPGTASKTYTVGKKLFQDGRMSEDLPFGSRGGLAMRHYFPLDGEYRLKIRLLRNYVDYVRGLSEPHELDVRIDGKRIRTFTVGGEDRGAPAPVSYAGNISGSAEWERYALSADEGLELRFHADAGPHVVGVSFVRRPGEVEGVLQPPQTGYAFAVDQTRSSPTGVGGPAVESVSIDGPYDPTGPGDTPSRRAIFRCRPSSAHDEETCATTILSSLARRAYRRPVTGGDVETLLSFYRTGRADRGFESGIQFALERILIDPDFLFRLERDPVGAQPGGVYRVSDLELASRLSFFLWSSIPDEELLDLAARGALRAPGALERQVRRMLADDRARALVDNFAAQWLSLRDLQAAEPNPDLFPDFDDNLRDAFHRETELFLTSQLRGDRSVVELLTADYTFLNERLARHYGISGVYGTHFRRVTLSDDTRGGLLGHGSVLTVTSYGNRTSPVLRGHWLLENVLGAPPPPPPPDVPGLPERSAAGRPQSVRERMEEHRRNPACASCHVRMDPLGFALEHFDAVGRWRDTGEGGTPIDATGTLPDGTGFEGLPGLRAHLAGQRELFVSTVAEKLLTYALGRGVDPYDRPAIRGILREAARSDYRWSAVILGIVNSTPFQMRSTE